MTRISFLLALCFLISPSLIAQEEKKDPNVTIAPELFDGMKWRSVGPSRGGRVTAVCGIAEQPFTFYMGATGGGVWKTNDAGTTWKNVSDGQIEAGSIGAITVAPSDPTIVYVGTGSACPRGNVSPGIGMYRSKDSGKTWKTIGLEKAGQIGRIEVHPSNPDLLYVAALGQIFGPNPERGVYRSVDGGENWEAVLSLSDSTGAIDLAMNPENPREIYAAMWRAERKPWTLVDGNDQGGIWKTMDGGDTWEKLGGGLPNGLLGRIGLALSPVEPDRVWAIIMAAEEEKGGVYRTDNAGASWSRINRDHNLRQRGWYYSHITADPTDKNTVYCNNVRFFKSIDGGKNFDQRIRVPHGDNHALWINPNNPNIMIHGNDGGACVSLNGGESWSTQYNQPTSEFYRITVDQQFPYRLYAGQQDNSTISVPSRDPGGVTDFQNWYSVGGSECGDVAVHPDNPALVWAGSYSGEITITNRETGQTRQVTAYPHYTEGTEQRDLKYRWQWNFPIQVSRFNTDVVYHTSNYVHRSTDKGQTWEIISPDLTRNLDEYHDIPGGPIQHDATGVEVYSSIFAFEESPDQEGALWVGSDDGLLHLSRDGGKNWQNITPKGMPKEGTVNKIELSIHAAGRAFLAVYNYRYNDFKPYIYRTNDYGQNWTLLTNGKNGIPEDHFVRGIAEDPDRKGLLYAGTEFGAYVSFDDGVHWQSLQLNLPHVPITDMEVHQKDLVISTQGRAFWILDNLSPLHEVSNEMADSEATFFSPRPAYRTNIYGYGPAFHLYLKENPESDTPVVLEIADSKGQVVRTYSTKTEKSLDKIKVKEGFNTLSWDLRHHGPELVDNLVTMVISNPSPGPRAVPGTYTATIRMGDWSQSRSLEVLPDPRWTDVTTADYEAQLEMAIEISNMITESHRRIKNLRSIREQVNSKAELAVKAGHSDQCKKVAKIIDTRLTTVEDLIIQNKAEASQDNINYPRVFSNHIGRLYGVVVNAHHRATGGALERFADLKKEYAHIVEQYEAVMKEDLPRFEELMGTEGVERIVVPERW